MTALEPRDQFDLNLRYGTGAPPSDIGAIVALFSDSCTAMHLTRAGREWLCAEDGSGVTICDLAIWIEAPSDEEWEPYFKSLRSDEYVP